MIIDNFIKATQEFLSMFDLRLENKKTNELSYSFFSGQELAVFNLQGDYVGKIFEVKNKAEDKNSEVTGTYYISVMLKDKELAAKYYRNTKEESTYQFKYSLIKHNKDDRDTLDGFFTIKKDLNNKIVIGNEYRVYNNGIFSFKCTFEPGMKNCYIHNHNTKEKVEYNENNFKYTSEPISIKIHCYDNLIYYEKRYPLSEEKSFAQGTPYYGKKMNTPEIINTVLKTIGEEYYNFIDNIKNKTDEIMPGFYNKTINKVFNGKENIDYRRIYKGIRQLILEESIGASKVKGRKNIKRNKK